MAVVAIVATLLGFAGAAAQAAVPYGEVTVVARGIDRPLDVAFGADGNMWFTSTANSLIGRVTPAGAVTLFADATLHHPWAIAPGPDGNVWFTTGFGDADPGGVGRITPAGAITVFGAPGIAHPAGLTAGPDGNVWFVNSGAASVGRITPGGAVTTFPDGTIGGARSIVVGPDANLWFTNHDQNSIGRITTAGVVSSFTGLGISGPLDIASGPDGALWFTNETANTVQRMTTAGALSSPVLPAGMQPRGITSAPDGNLWLTDVAAGAVARLTPGGVVTSFPSAGIVDPLGITAGAGGALWFANRSGDGVGRTTTAGVTTLFGGTRIKQPTAIVQGPDGNLWFTNNGNRSIGQITPGGVVTQFTGTGIDAPTDIALGPDGNLWFTNYLGNTIGRITPAGVVSSFTGTGILNPIGITAGPGGALWFTNGNNSIGRITTGGAVANFSGPAINNPQRIAAGADGNLWFTNRGSSSIGRITPAGAITTFSDPSIASPQGIAPGPDGAMWFTNDVSSGSVGRITPSGVVSVIADAAFVRPQAIAPGPLGSMWVANGNHDLVQVTAAGAVLAHTTSGVDEPVAITPGPDGTMWFADRSGSAVGRVGATPLPPAAPTNVTGTPKQGAATISWTAPADDGGAPITGYTVTASDGHAACSTTGARSCTVEGLLGLQAYTFTVRATNVAGTGPPSAASAPVIPQAGSTFHPVVPTRILDSRTVNGGWSGALVAGAPRDLAVTSAAAGAPVPSGAAAVVMNVTVTQGSAPSLLTVWPAGADRPITSNLNFAAGQTTPNLVTVKLGVGGMASFANAIGAVHVIADVVGYYDAGQDTGGRFTGITPTRLLDSRTGTGNWGAPLVAGAPRDLLVRKPGNALGVPATATAIVANVTATGATAGSFLSVWPSGVDQPTASNLNFAAGETIPNLAIVKIGGNGAIRFANAVGAVDVIVDVLGYFDPTAGGRFYSITPTRILDDRVGTGLSGPWSANQSRSLPVAGVSGNRVPAGATGLVANVTATGGTAGSFVTVYPDGVAQPTSSNLNFGATQTIPNLVTVTLPANGKVAFYNQLGKVDLVADAVGYYAPQ
jgi:streptogramin lyase